MLHCKTGHFSEPLLIHGACRNLVLFKYSMPPSCSCVKLGLTTAANDVSRMENGKKVCLYDNAGKALVIIIKC